MKYTNKEIDYFMTEQEGVYYLYVKVTDIAGNETIIKSSPPLNISFLPIELQQQDKTHFVWYFKVLRSNSVNINFNHTPVLLSECIENLNIKPNGIYVDGTMRRCWT